MSPTITHYRHRHDGLMYRVTSTPARRPPGRPTLTMQRRRDYDDGPMQPATGWSEPVTIDQPQLRGLLAFSFTKEPEPTK